MNEERENRKARRRRRRPSLFWPLILIALGVVFLLNNLGVMTGDVWNNVLRLWPVLLIAIGLDSVYRGEGLVGGVFMIGIGSVFLLANLGYLVLDVWRMAFNLWPVLLIAIGFDIIFGRRSIWASLVGLVLILAILAGALWFSGVTINRGQALAGEQVSQALEGATQASLNIQPGAGGLHLHVLSNSNDLIAGTVASPMGLKVTNEFTNQGGNARYTLQAIGSAFYSRNASGAWDWDLGLNPSIPLDLHVSLGAGSAEIDLSGLNLSALDVSMGVGKTEVHLPETGNFSGKVECAIGQIVVYVPAGMAVRINSDTGLANISVPSGYEKQGDLYTSPGYASALNRIDLTLGQAIGNITVQAAGQ